MGLILWMNKRDLTKFLTINWLFVGIWLLTCFIDLHSHKNYPRHGSYSLFEKFATLPYHFLKFREFQGKVVFSPLPFSCSSCWVGVGVCVCFLKIKLCCWKLKNLNYVVYGWSFLAEKDWSCHNCPSQNSSPGEFRANRQGIQKYQGQTIQTLAA